MKIKEIKAGTMNTDKFIADKIRDIQNAVGDGLAINALSGGVDSCVVTALGHKALGTRLITCLVDNGLMRKGEPAMVQAQFKKLGIGVEIVDAAPSFFRALRGITDPEEKERPSRRHFIKRFLGNWLSKAGQNTCCRAPS